jgi:Uma2 family endonuclease
MKGREKMATLTQLGPADHGRPMSLEDFMSGDYLEGYEYELIDGKLIVSPQPNLPEDSIDTWINLKVTLYSQANLAVINYVTRGAWVFIPNRPGVTNPQPDLAAFQDFPLDRPLNQRRWQDVSPILVAETLSAEDPDKDLIRNVKLYLQVPSIREYWVFDTRSEGADRPTLKVHRRRASRWQIIDVAFGETYTTRLLPTFELVVDPRR